MTELSNLKFVQNLIDCLKEYKKQLGDTRSEPDSAHFFNPDLKRFIKKHEKEFKLLSTINCERSFLKFCETYFFNK